MQTLERLAEVEREIEEKQRELAQLTNRQTDAAEHAYACARYEYDCSCDAEMHALEERDATRRAECARDRCAETQKTVQEISRQIEERLRRIEELDRRSETPDRMSEPAEEELAEEKV